MCWLFYWSAACWSSCYCLLLCFTSCHGTTHLRSKSLRVGWKHILIIMLRHDGALLWSLGWVGCVCVYLQTRHGPSLVLQAQVLSEVLQHVFNHWIMLQVPQHNQIFIVKIFEDRVVVIEHILMVSTKLITLQPSTWYNIIHHFTQNQRKFCACKSLMIQAKCIVFANNILWN